MNTNALQTLPCMLFCLVISFCQLEAQDTIIHYTETTGFNHNTASESLALFQQIGQEHGFVVLQDGDGSLFNKTDLGQAKAVVFSNTSGNSGLNANQQAALEWFVDTLGRHMMGIHAATDTYRHSSANGNDGGWDWYAETMGGSVQQGPNHTSANHVDTIYLVQDHPSADNIDFPWVKEEEYYYWENGYLNGDLQTILRVGETGNNSYDASRPVAWYRTNAIGSKVFYTSLGHRKSNFTGSFPEFEQLIEDAVLWLLDCPSVAVSMQETICEGEAVNFNGQTITEAGEYMGDFTNTAGCDSTVTLTVTVIPTNQTAIQETICQGETINFAGQAISEEGQYTGDFTNAGGCDSTVTLTVTVIPTDKTNTEVSICAGESFFFDGQSLTESGSYSAMLTNASGCDSIVFLTLTVFPISQTVFTETICDGESVTFNGDILTVPGDYSALFSDQNGCDSTAMLSLEVLPLDTTNLSVAICEGENYVFDETALTEAGTYSATFTNEKGCDSLVLLDLLINPEEETQEEATICNGDTYSFHGELLTEPGSYNAIFTNQGGCDSTVNLTLNVLQPDTAVILNEGTLVAQATSATFQWLDCGNGFAPINGATEASFTPTQEGNYAVLISQNGCQDTSLCYSIILSNIERLTLEKSVQLFPNPVKDKLTVAVTPIDVRYQLVIFTSDGSIIWSGQFNQKQRLEIDTKEWASGLYQVVIKSERASVAKSFIKE